MKKPTKAEIIAYIEAQEKEHWESLSMYSKDLGTNDYRVQIERARWNAYWSLLNFINP